MAFEDVAAELFLCSDVRQRVQPIHRIFIVWGYDVGLRYF